MVCIKLSIICQTHQILHVSIPSVWKLEWYIWVKLWQYRCTHHFVFNRLCCIVHAGQDSCVGLLLDGSVGVRPRMEISWNKWRTSCICTWSTLQCVCICNIVNSYAHHSNSTWYSCRHCQRINFVEPTHAPVASPELQGPQDCINEPKLDAHTPLCKFYKANGSGDKNIALIWGAVRWCY